VRVFPADFRALHVKFGGPLEDLAAKFCLELDETHVFTDGNLHFQMLAYAQSRSACVFLSGNLCSIHEAKPLICKLAPFSYSHWSSEHHRQVFRSISPGFGRGRGVPQTEIDASVQQEIDAWAVYLNDVQSTGAPWWASYGFQRRPALPVREIRVQHDLDKSNETNQRRR
jgi:Fe-S-cluster containining protein